jgi:hypothetical protein
MMVFDLSVTNAHYGDGHVAVDRGFSRVVDMGDKRRLEAVKVVYFRDDDESNATSWFACIWWDLMVVRTATMCPNAQITPRRTLIAGARRTATSPQPMAGDGSTAVPQPAGPLETFATAWGDLVSGFTRESIDMASRTAKRWPAGEQVTGGKLTSDLIEGFERLTPSLGKGIDLWLGAAQKTVGGLGTRATTITTTKDKP